ncbi:hypothetical protein [Aliarcobacter butzleri]|uniref:hypothetical protein n=1 Tax=Aliarcobacter butzleri TaxID=28197 RepID=UPI00263DCED9|nr:hypothetical protein [Aliarcobacter butzleri]MDN5053797.1 hypothetical protein [Aliarcobacter butzleri]
MPKDNNALSQNWNIKDQIEQSKKINQDNKQTIDDYKAKTESIKTIQSSLDELENSGQDVSVLRKKFDEKISNNDLSFGEKLGVVGRNIGNDYLSSFSKAFGGNLEKTYSTNLDDIKQKREEVINPISTIASEVALDPLTYTPLSLATKGTKTVRMAKDFGKGGALSAGLYTAKEYGDDNYKPTDSLIAGAFGGALNAGIGRFLNRKSVGDLPNADVTSSDDIANKFIYEQKKVNPEVVTKPTQPTADELVQENIIKTDNQDEIAKRIYEANFKNKDNLIKTDDLKTNKIVNQNDIELPPIKEKSVLPDTLPLNDKEAMKDIMKYAKDNNAVDEFISKLPQNARVDEVRQVFDKMPISQSKENPIGLYERLKNDYETSPGEKIQLKQNADNYLLNQMSVQEPRKTNSGIYYSNGTQSFGGASVGGLESEFNQRDYNYDGEHNYKDNVIGALIGAIGINAARKIFPNVFRDKNIDANTTGMFVGKNPTDTVRVDNQGKYKIPLNEDVKELSKIKTDELNFKEFNNLEAKHKEQGITDSKSLKRIIDRVLQNPNIYAKGTQKDSSLVALRKNGADDIVVANSKNGNVISAFKNTDEKYMDKIIDKSMSGRPSSTVLRQGVDSTTSSKDGYNVASHSVDKSIPNNILNSQDIKLNASPTVSGGIVGAITGATSDLDNDGKITYKDLLYGAIGGAGLTKGVLMAKDSNIIQKSRELFKKASDTDFADAIVGHKIYEKKDYMNIREDMLKAKNQKLEDFTQLHEQLKLLDDSTRKDMYKYMSGDKNINLDTNIKTLADSYTNEINKLSKEMVDLGILDEAQFDKFKDRYLHRRYDKDLSQKFNSLFSKGKTVSGVFSRGKEWSGTKAEYEKLLNNGEIGDFFNGKIEATKMQNGQYKFRQDWTDEQRTKWGEIKDIAFSLPETLMRSTEMVQHGKMLKKIVDETKYVSNEALDGYVQLNGNKYGALKGKYVPKDMASDINEFHSAIFGNEGGLFSKDVVDAYKALSSFWKKTHTVYNPIAHMNNLLSNITMQFGAGINPHKAVKNAYKGAITSQKVKQFRELKAKELIGLSSEERVSLNALIQDDDIKLWNEAQRAGLFGRSGLNDILNQYVNPTKATNSSNLTGTRKVLNKFDDLASRAYQGEDNIMRFSMLKSLTEKGKSLDEAIKEINNTIPDYTKPMSRLARFGRDSMLTPFISWTYYSTPIILKQFKDRPERIAAIYASLYGLNKLAGIDPFDEKDIPQQNFAMKRIPIYKNGNEVTTIKVDRWIPHNDMLNPIDMAKNLTNGGAWRAIPDILNNSNSYFGGKITNNEGALKAYDLSKYGVQQITPDILDNVWNLAESKMLSKEKRTKNPVIQPRTTTQELLKFFGINSMTYNKANQARKVSNEKIK